MDSSNSDLCILEPNGQGYGGGIRSLCPEEVGRYYGMVQQKSQSFPKYELIKEVRELRDTIYSDPVIRMSLQGSLDILATKNNPKVPLTGKSIEQTLMEINAVATNPPVFQNRDIIGVPFSILFYGLLNNHGQIFFGNPKVNHHLKEIFDAYGTLLKSEKSKECLNKTNGWLSPEAQKFVNYADFIHDPNDPYFGYACWNDWFIRRLAPGARPIDSNPNTIVNSSDSYCLESPKQPVYNVQRLNSFWLKDDNYSLYDMFGVTRMGDKIQQIVDQSFVGGTVYQAFLNPWCYHRWHAPVSGTLEKSYRLSGTYLLQNPNSDLNNDGQDNYINTQPMLTSLSTRYIFIINTHNPLIGRVAVIEIGMGEVSSCISIVNSGQEITKGQEIGRFEFGGSSHAIVFDRKAKLKFNPAIYDTDHKGYPALQKVGVWLAEAQSQ